MAVRANPEPESAGHRTVSRLDAWLDEMFRENAMMEEATRFLRQFFRTGGSAGQGANIVILGIMALFYLWFIATMIRFDMCVTIPIQYAELFLVTLITPASMYAAISGEREKATWDALTLTRLTPAQIIAGKMAWRIGVVAFIMAVLMVAVVVSQLMGNDPLDRPSWAAVIAAQAMIFTWGVLLCAFSLWVSAHTRQSVTTIALVIGSILGFVVMLPSLMAMFGATPDLDDMEKPFQIIGGMVFWMNPYFVMYSLGGQYNQEAIPPLPPIGWAFLIAALFLLAAVFLIRSSHTRIKRLEEPVRAG